MYAIPDDLIVHSLALLYPHAFNKFSRASKFFYNKLKIHRDELCKKWTTKKTAIIGDEKHYATVLPNNLFTGEYIVVNTIINKRVETKTYANGILHGKYTKNVIKKSYQGQYYISERIVTNYDNGELHGEYKIWNNYSGKRYTAKYSRGKLHGKEAKYYLSGGVQEINHYCNGVLHGPHKKFDCDGEVLVDAEYQNGKLNGLYIEYKDRKRVMSAYYTKGQLDGTRSYYRPNGEISRQEFWVQGGMDRCVKYPSKN